ncbi:hypothetical protein RU639_001582 [Aspergillus parasiticus]
MSARSRHALFLQPHVPTFARESSMTSYLSSKWDAKDLEETSVVPQTGETMFTTVLGCVRQDTKPVHCQPPNNASRRLLCVAQIISPVTVKAAVLAH